MFKNMKVFFILINSLLLFCQAHAADKYFNYTVPIFVEQQRVESGMVIRAVLKNTDMVNLLNINAVINNPDLRLLQAIFLASTHNFSEFKKVVTKNTSIDYSDDDLRIIMNGASTLAEKQQLNVFAYIDLGKEKAYLAQAVDMQGKVVTKVINVTSSELGPQISDWKNVNPARQMLSYAFFDIQRKNGDFNDFVGGKSSGKNIHCLVYLDDRTCSLAIDVPVFHLDKVNNNQIDSGSIRDFVEKFLGLYGVQDLSKQKLKPFFHFKTLNKLNSQQSALEEIVAAYSSYEGLFILNAEPVYIVYLGKLKTGKYDIRKMMYVFKGSKGLKIVNLLDQNVLDEILMSKQFIGSFM